MPKVASQTDIRSTTKNNHGFSVAGDVLEGNPTFSFVLLFGVVLTYMGVLPYCAAGPRLLCVLRELGTSLGHALMLSVMLARAIMLTTTDEQGFMSHVSGYLQFALWFFIVAVQVRYSCLK